MICNDRSTFSQSLINDFCTDISQRIKQLDSQLNSINHDGCECDIYALLRRQIDLLQLLGYRQSSQLQQKFIEAEEMYKEQQLLTMTHQLLDEIAQISKNLTADDFLDIDLTVIDQFTSNNSECEIYLLLQEAKSSYLESILSSKGFKVTCLENQDQLNTLHDSQAKGVLVIQDDVNIYDGNAFDLINEIRKNHQLKLDHVIVSKQVDFNKRLRAVREEVILTDESQNDYGEVVRIIEQLVQKKCLTNKNILLVSQDKILSKYISMVLGSVGLSVIVIDSVKDDQINILEGHAFDMIMIDYFMDDVYGYEISQIIRCYEYYVYVPILFMCSKLDLECVVHPELISKHGYMMDQYDPVSIVNSVTDTIKDSFDSYKLGKYMADALRESENRRIALDSHCIVSITDVSGEIIDVNEKFCVVSGYDRNELIGKQHNVINSGMHPKKYFIEMWGTISSGKVWHGEVCNRKKNGELYWVESTIVPFLNEIGKPYQYVSVRTDITNIKVTEEKLRLSEGRLLRSQSFANIGTWDWNIITGDLYWSPKIATLFGYQEGELETTYDNFLNAVHEDDRKSVIDAVNNCVEQGLDYDIEHRCVWPDGTVKWMLERGDVVRSSDGKPLHMLGVVQDITSRKQAEIDLDKQKQLLEFLKDGLTSFVDEDDFLFVAESIIGELLKLTGSEYGFTGEIIYDGLRPYLKIHAVSSQVWDDETVDMYHQKCSDGLEIHALDNLLGTMIIEKDVVICNEIKNNDNDRSMPKNHLDIERFLGIPIFYGDKLIGVYGLANRKSDYSQNDVDFLKPFNATYGAIIHAKYMADMQKETLQLVQESKSQAVKASQAKSQFLANMSHELRTPMNAILGFGQLLGMEIGQELNESQRDNVKEILKAGNHLLELINEILDLARIEAGKIDLKLEPVLLSNVIDESISIVQSQLDKHENSIEFSINNKICDPEKLSNLGVKVYADAVRLKQIVLNLLSNAIKYNKKHGKVIVDFQIKDSDTITLHVKDNGIGIPEDKQTELFQSFHRLGAEATEIEGTGIGLVITKQIVELMGGSIGFESEEGIGSDFWVDLILSHGQQSVDVSLNSQSDIDLKQTTTKHVVYVEDNPANMRLVTQLMSSFDQINLITAHEAELGMMLIKQYKPDLILLDINLPGLSGLELLQMIKSEHKISSTPVVAISANAMESDIEKAMSAGFDEYITKPINVPNFMKILGNYLQ